MGDACGMDGGQDKMRTTAVQQTCKTYSLLAAGTIVRPVTSFGNNFYAVNIVIV
jgi:hypothetical protein